ncbi:MAG TPA: SDR family NAD(P)-dependent oxidoreductase [Candidatus Paceibacterota bacterium]|nr:SDR family NAD(P)-dependent oxidoreductase [Candidatus Paceibacterota bacterium]
MKTVVITGIGKGIGKALALKFLEDGFRVVGTTLSSMPDYSHEHLDVYTLDLGSYESISACVTEITNKHPHIDIVINNAGVLLDESEVALVPELLRKTLEINVIGTTTFTEQILPHVQSGGHVVVISSSAGSLERAGKAISHFPFHYPAYKISKAALNMYVRTLALRLKEENVTVSAIHPGWVKTDIGGVGAEMAPEEAAEGIYQTSINAPETGNFWFKGEKLPW